MQRVREHLTYLIRLARLAHPDNVILPEVVLAYLPGCHFSQGVYFLKNLVGWWWGIEGSGGCYGAGKRVEGRRLCFFEGDG